MADRQFEPYLARWSLTPDGPAFETHSSWLVPVNRDRAPAMLKVSKPTSDEGNSAAWLRYIDGDGAVRLYEADDQAVLLERAVGQRSLMAMATSGQDLEAAEILATTVARLHAQRNSPCPTEMTPLESQFSALYARAASMPLLGRCAAVARGLLATTRDAVPLHGDLHHNNVVDGGTRGWLALDPKALLGERAYEIANLLGNPFPHGDIVHRPERMKGLAEFYAGRLQLDLRRVLGFALAHAGLAASWDMDDDCDPTYRLRCAEVLDPMVD